MEARPGPAATAAAAAAAVAAAPSAQLLRRPICLLRHHLPHFLHMLAP